MQKKYKKAVLALGHNGLERSKAVRQPAWNSMRK